MTNLTKSALAAAIALTLSACGGQQSDVEDTTATQLDLEDEMTRQSYAMGVNVGSYIAAEVEQHQEVGIELDEDAIRQAFLDALAGEAQLSDDEAQDLVFALREEFTRAQNEVVGGQNREDGLAYQEENAARDEVTVTESGLQYEVLREGDGGPTPGPEDMVEVHYEGTLIDGTVFDSSYEREETIEFPLNQVIPGWSEGVQLMDVGSKYRFVIPSELAYGDNEVGGGLIQPNSTLVFEVELLDVTPASEVEED